VTYTPSALSTLRGYLQPITGLDPVSLGIQHWTAQGGGYHEGWDLLRMGYGWGDYSVSESPRDAHPSNAASAIDIGYFAVTAPNGRRVTLRDLSLWLVGQCRAGAPDTLDVREIIYSPDGQVVKRWDRLGVRSSGDDSHLSHTHVSYFRDSEGRDKTALFRRFFEGDDDNMDAAAYTWLGQRFGDIWTVITGIETQLAGLAKVVEQLHLESRNTESLVTQAFVGGDRPAYHDDMVGYTYPAHVNAPASALAQVQTALKQLTDPAVTASAATPMEESMSTDPNTEPATTDPQDAGTAAAPGTDPAVDSDATGTLDQPGSEAPVQQSGPVADSSQPVNQPAAQPDTGE
jgi:hypothetical protein